MPMHKYQAVISGVGPDKPGIVAAITRVLLQHSANIEDSTMTRLAHEFAFILIVTLEKSSSLETLEESLYELEKEIDVSFTIRPLDPHPDYAVTGEPCLISVGGNDRTGITQAVAEQLARLNVNITDLNAQVIEGDNGPAYIMMIEAIVPEPLTLPILEKTLQEAEGCQELEIRVNKIDSLMFD